MSIESFAAYLYKRRLKKSLANTNGIKIEKEVETKQGYTLKVGTKNGSLYILANKGNEKDRIIAIFAKDNEADNINLIVYGKSPSKVPFINSRNKDDLYFESIGEVLYVRNRANKDYCSFFSSSNNEIYQESKIGNNLSCCII